MNNNPLNDLENTKDGKTIMMYIRTFLYVAGVIAAIVALVITTYGDAKLGSIIAQAAAFISSAFGVAYNPLQNGGNK